MQPVAAQDRPKLIATGAAIVVALAFVACEVGGSAPRTQPREPVATAMSSPPVASGPIAAASPSDASAVTPGEATAAPTGIDAPARLHLHDPFRPITKLKIAVSPAATPATVPPPAAPTVVRQDSPRSRPEAVGAPIPLDGTQVARRPAQRISEPPAEPTGDPAVPVVLTGTVGSGDAAVATFRVGKETVFARPEEMVAGWRVVRIQVGQAWLSRRNARELMRVGNSLPGDPRLTDRTAAVPAG